MESKKKDDFEYSILEHVGTVAQHGSMTIEVNLISYNGAPAKVDIRKWRVRDGERVLSKGLTLTNEEAEKLVDLLKAIS